VLLGDLITRCSDEAVAEEIVLSIGDLAMLAALRDQSEMTGMGVGACVAAAAQRYVAEASDEEWITLIGLMGKTQDPGVVFLKRALAYSRQRPGQGDAHVGHA